MKKRGAKLCALMMAAVMALTACGGSSNSGSSTTAAGGSQGAAAETSAAVPPENAPEAEIPEGESVSQEQDIVAAVRVDITTMDPMDTSDTLSGGIQRMVMDGLFGFDDDMKIFPMLATEYEANEEATEYTFKLREGISFTDGTPWNADAAIANFEKWADKDLGLKRTTLLCNVLDHFEKIDDYTVKVYLSEPFGAFIATLAHPACVMMSPVQIAAGPETCALDPVGTGQYTFGEWVEGDHVTLNLNKDWWGYDADLCGGTALAASDAGFKSVTFRPVAEDATRIAMIQSGDAQIIWPAPTESVELLRQDPNVNVQDKESITVWYMTLNTQKPPLNDVRVRQAMNYAINKEAYIQVVMNGQGSLATSCMGPAVQHYKGNDPYPYDVEKAKELLTEAGYPDGFTVTLTYANTSANQKKAEFYKQQLSEVGINLELNGMENAVMNEAIQGATGPGSDVMVVCYLTGWSTSTGDADWALRPLLATESEPPLSYNTSYYENEEFDQLLQEALQTADETKRAEAYAKAQDIMWEDVPMICVANDFNTWVTSKNIAGVKLYPDQAINMKNARMAAK